MGKLDQADEKSGNEFTKRSGPFSVVGETVADDFLGDLGVPGGVPRKRPVDVRSERRSLDATRQGSRPRMTLTSLTWLR